MEAQRKGIRVVRREPHVEREAIAVNASEFHLLHGQPGCLDVDGASQQRYAKGQREGE